MLIRSQDKKMLIPLGDFVIGATKDNCIVASKNAYITPSEVEPSTIGKYSTKENAIKVLDMISSAWENNSGKFRYVFQMPQDDEVIYWTRQY